MIKMRYFSLLNNFFRFEFFRFTFFGGIATLFDWVLFYFLALELSIPYEISLFFSFSLASLINYALNKMFTFRCKSKRIGKQISVFYSIAIISLICSLFLMFVFVDLLLMKKMFSRILTTIITLGINYVLHKFFTFNKKFFNDELIRV